MAWNGTSCNWYLYRARPSHPAHGPYPLFVTGKILSVNDLLDLRQALPPRRHTLSLFPLKFFLFRPRLERHDPPISL